MLPREIGIKLGIELNVVLLPLKDEPSIFLFSIAISIS